jgi:predicted GNAT family N-acyltransferase
MDKTNFPFRIETLEANSTFGAFASGDADLDDFLQNDAKKYLESLLSVTYLFKTDDETIAYFSLSNDRLLKDEEGKAEWNRLNRRIANEKRRKSYPSVKIGRLAVAQKYAGLGLGKRIIETVIAMYTKSKALAGCRFVTVDAYQKALGFYQKNGFAFLTENDANDSTRVMYLDLKPFV